MIRIFVFSLMIFIIAGCSNISKKTGDNRYVFDFRFEKDSIEINSEYVGGQYLTYSKRLLFYVEDGSNEVFYSDSLSFNTYKELKIDKEIIEKIKNITADLLEPSNLNLSKQCKKDSNVFFLNIQPIQSDVNRVSSGQFIKCRYFYENDISEISPELADVFTSVKKIINKDDSSVIETSVNLN